MDIILNYYETLPIPLFFACFNTSKAQNRLILTTGDTLDGAITKVDRDFVNFHTEGKRDTAKVAEHLIRAIYTPSTADFRDFPKCSKRLYYVEGVPRDLEPSPEAHPSNGAGKPSPSEITAEDHLRKAGKRFKGFMTLSLTGWIPVVVVRSISGYIISGAAGVIAIVLFSVPAGHLEKAASKLRSRLQL